jgi:CheY-like chemotaxis protein
MDCSGWTIPSVALCACQKLSDYPAVYFLTSVSGLHTTSDQRGGLSGNFKGRRFTGEVRKVEAFFVAVIGPSGTLVGALGRNASGGTITAVQSSEMAATFFMNDSKSGASARNILVVDDTSSVADLMREMLLSFGYKAEVCESAKEALVLFDAGKFDLVITDYTMPGINGVELARLMRQRVPNQSIILITGSSYSLADNATLPVNSVLQKPFSVEEFQQAVAMALVVVGAAAAMPPGARASL